MAVSVQVHCINKSDRYNAHERIINIGGVRPDGVRWKRSQPQAIQDIEAGTYAYYVAVSGQKIVWLVVAVSAWGNKYLKTEADGDQPNNLLALPECP